MGSAGARRESRGGRHHRRPLQTRRLSWRPMPFRTRMGARCCVTASSTRRSGYELDSRVLRDVISERPHPWSEDRCGCRRRGRSLRFDLFRERFERGVAGEEQWHCALEAADCDYEPSVRVKRLRLRHTSTIAGRRRQIVATVRRRRRGCRRRVRRGLDGSEEAEEHRFGGGRDASGMACLVPSWPAQRSANSSPAT